MKFEEMINTIQQGDCYELIKKIPDKSINCIYVDVPYLYATGSHGESELSKRIYKYQKLDLKNAGIYDGFDYKIYDEFIRISKNVNIFIWCSRLQIVDTLNYFVSKGYKYNILTWNKTNPTPATNNSWLPDIEYCLVFRDSNTKLNDGYELKSKWYVSAINQKDKELFKHPTIKPLDLVKRHILHSTQPNDIILDCFCGSGTTCLAAKETGRKFIGMELNEEYHKIAVDRLNGITADGQIGMIFENI